MARAFGGSRLAPAAAVALLKKYFVNRATVRRESAMSTRSGVKASTASARPKQKLSKYTDQREGL
jgi:hypothetical protein